MSDQTMLPGGEIVDTASLADVRHAVAATSRRAVEARFYLIAVTRRQAWAGPADEDQPAVVAVVEFNAAKHGTFGKATPSGVLTMTIANPDAAALLDAAQREALMPPRRQSPVFRAWFVEELPDEEE